MSRECEFTKEMKKTHTIFMPDMLHYHNELLCAAFQYGGYKLKIVPEYHELCKETFSMINKDYCTCAFYIVGNLLTMLEKADVNRNQVAFLEPQAGGSCRAGNYYNLIIECLRKAGYSNIPVISLNAHGLEKNSGFQINCKMLFGAIAGVCYSDLLMTLTQQIQPYEINKGEAVALRKKWINRLYKDIANGKNIFHRKKLYEEIVQDFQKIKTDPTRKKTKVGIVGEVYIKYSPIGNQHLEEFLKNQNCDYRQEGFINYCIYAVYTEMQSKKLSGKNKVVIEMYSKVIDYLRRLHHEINVVLQKYDFMHDGDFYEIRKEAVKILSDYYNIGDGWLITAETIDLIRQGYDKILMVHPFGCLVSHVGERGVIKKLHELYPGAKVSSVEFDIDQSKTLMESRILLAIS